MVKLLFVSMPLMFILGTGLGYVVSQANAPTATEQQMVDSFNDGFLDGVCHNGEDGLGNTCKN